MLQRPRRGIIFDLDECIIHTMKENHYDNVEKELLVLPEYMSARQRMFSMDLKDFGVSRGTGRNNHMWGVTRPHLIEFLKFCRGYFQFIGVWSAAVTPYIDNIVHSVFLDILTPDIVYSRDMVENLSKDDYHKPITRMLNDPRVVGKIDIKEVFFLDDKNDNFRSSPSNGVTIPRYEPYPNYSSIMADDTSLLQFQQWLSKPEVIVSNDIRLLDKSLIFNTPTFSLYSTPIVGIPSISRMKTGYNPLFPPTPGFNTIPLFNITPGYSSVGYT